MSARVGFTQAQTTTIDGLAAYGATAALASGVVAAVGTVLLFLTFATQASTMLEPTTELTPLDRAANGLGGLAMLLAIPTAFRLHQSWRVRAPAVSGTALTIGLVSLLAYGLLLLLLAGGFFSPADLGTLSVVPLGGIGLWIILVSVGPADPALGGVLRWIGLAIGIGNLLLLVSFFGAGGSAAVTDPKVVFESPLLLVGVLASLLSAQIGYPIWAIWLSRRLRPEASTHDYGRIQGRHDMTEQNAGEFLRARVTQFVRAPIERVYAAYVDPALIPKWMGIKAVTDVSGPLDRPGTTFTEIVYPFHRPRTEVLAAEPPVLHEMGGRTLGGFGYRWTTRFAEKGDGTEITFDVEVRFPPGLIGAWVRRSQEGGRMERGVRQRFAEFAKLVEAKEV